MIIINLPHSPAPFGSFCNSNYPVWTLWRSKWVVKCIKVWFCRLMHDPDGRQHVHHLLLDCCIWVPSHRSWCYTLYALRSKCSSYQQWVISLSVRALVLVVVTPLPVPRKEETWRLCITALMTADLDTGRSREAYPSWQAEKSQHPLWSRGGRSNRCALTHPSPV